MDFFFVVCYNNDMTNDSRLLRMAAQEEKDFYTHALYPLQDDVMEVFDNNNPAFYLTGGTALSRFHYHHRFSDDLDFFYDGFNFPKENFNFYYREVVSKLEKAFPSGNLEVTLEGEFFKRIFLKRDEVTLKIEFIFEQFRTVGEKTRFKGVPVDSKQNICANKIGTVMDRRAVKDFIDLYYLLKEISLEDAVGWSEIKKVPPDYEGLMMGVGDLLEHPERLEGTALLCKPLEQDEFTLFTKKLLGDLFKHAKLR